MTTKPKFKKGAKIRWTSKGPAGTRKREGRVVGFCAPGEAITKLMPKSADLNKFKAQKVNHVHARYLIEIPRTDRRNGQRLASSWMATKAVTLEQAAKVVE